MKKHACRYAIVRFMPYPETGEFANVGVVLACPQTGYFGYQLQTKRYSRFTRFFKDLDAGTYLSAIAAFEAELGRVAALLNGESNEVQIRNTFEMLLHPRDTILRFSEGRAILVADAPSTLKKLFLHHVNHDFVTQEYKENQLGKRVQAIVSSLQLEHPFKQDKLGSEDFSVNFPLIQRVGGEATKLIKPFYLGQDDPQRIYQHADPWFMKLRRLKERGQLPNRVLFTVEGPGSGERLDMRNRAYKEVCDYLAHYADVVPETNHGAIREFALGGY